MCTRSPYAIRNEKSERSCRRGMSTDPFTRKQTQTSLNLHSWCRNSAWQCILLLPRAPALWSHRGYVRMLNSSFLSAAKPVCLKSDPEAWERRKPEACLMEGQCLGLNYHCASPSFLSLSCAGHSASDCVPSEFPSFGFVLVFWM